MSLGVSVSAGAERELARGRAGVAGDELYLYRFKGNGSALYQQLAKIGGPVLHFWGLVRSQLIFMQLCMLRWEGYEIDLRWARGFWDLEGVQHWSGSSFCGGWTFYSRCVRGIY